MAYIETDEQNDVLASLEMVELALSHCEKNPNLWKWVLIALHSAVQGAMVCHLSDTAQLGALDDKSKRQWLKWYDAGMSGDEPSKRMLNPISLIETVQSKYAGSSSGPTERVVISDGQLADFVRLNDFRTNFVHFKPKGWSIETSGFPRIIKSQLEIIKSVSSGGWAFRHLDNSKRDALEAVLEKIQSAPVLSRLHTP